MTEEVIEKLLILALGWLLGLLGPIIVDSIKRRRENALGRQAILSELRELGCVLAVAAYGVRGKLGMVDRPFLEWLKSDMERYAVTTELQAFIPSLREQLSWPEPQLQAYFDLMKRDANKGTNLQKYPVPLLDSRVSALWSFDTQFQRALLEIRQNVAILDEIVERARRYLDLTFTNLSDKSHSIVSANHDQACLEYSNRAERVVKLVRALPR